MIFLPLIIFGPVAWILGKSDLASIRDGRMDPEGQSNTHAGYVMGIIATALYGLLVGVCCLFMIVAVAVNPNHH